MGKNKKYTDEQILDIIIDFLNSEDNKGNSKSYQKSGRKPTITTIVNRFGSWESCLEKAKQRVKTLEENKNHSNYKKTANHVNKVKDSKHKRSVSYSEDFILKQLADCKKENAGNITIQIYKNSKRKPSHTTIAKKFGSWSNAITRLLEKEEFENKVIELENMAKKNFIQEKFPLLDDVPFADGYAEVAASGEHGSNIPYNNNRIRPEHRFNHQSKNGFWRTTAKILSFGLFKNK